MAVSPSEKHRTSTPARAGPLWRTFHSSIYLSWHHRVCSPSHAEGPSCLTGETNVTSSPGCTDKPLEHRHISTFIWIWNLVIRPLMHQRWLSLSQQTVLLYVTAIIMLTPAVLYSLEQHFWAAWACPSMPTALLLLHTLFPELLVADTPWVPWMAVK